MNLRIKVSKINKGINLIVKNKPKATSVAECKSALTGSFAHIAS